MKKRIIQSILAILCILLTISYAVAQEGKILRITVYSPSLEGNLFKDSPDRPVTIYLPPSYDSDPGMRYPVVYLLHGYTGNDMLWTGGSYIRNGNIKDWMKGWLEDGKVKEMILVMPSSYNTFGGSFYTNSVTTGRWADYIAKDLVEYIDSHYRTLRQRESRAVIGHSMGGYGGMKLGILYPEVFGCIGGMAGVYITDDMLDRISHVFASVSDVKDFAKFYSWDWQSQCVLAWLAACVPNNDLPPFYCDFLFVYDKDGKIVKDQNVYDRFMEHSILRMTERYTDRLVNMRSIYIDCGSNDYIFAWPIMETRKLHEKLLDLGINHVYKEFIGDHTCCVMNSTGDALEVFSKAMAFEMLTGVEPKGKLATTWGEIRRSK